MILVIEDDPNILFALATLLEEEGHQVWCAENGAVGLELLRTRGMPDLILLDRLMPVMNGHQFVEEFRALYGSSTPVVVMTAAGEIEKRVSEMNVHGFISKPFSILELLKVMEQKLLAIPAV